jgi:hypothetical protein
MNTTEATERRSNYNFAHFRTRHLLADVAGTLTGRGVAPGALAPEFTLPRADGGSLSLWELRDSPVLLHFGSFT